MRFDRPGGGRYSCLWRGRLWGSGARGCGALRPAPVVATTVLAGGCCPHLRAQDSLLSPILGRLESTLRWTSCCLEAIEPVALFSCFTRLLDVPGRQHIVFVLNFPGYTDPGPSPRGYCRWRQSSTGWCSESLVLSVLLLERYPVRVTARYVCQKSRFIL